VGLFACLPGKFVCRVGLFAGWVCLPGGFICRVGLFAGWLAGWVCLPGGLPGGFVCLSAG
jgi:hypothetical protein